MELTPYWIIYIFHKYEVLIPIKNYTDFRIDIAFLIWRNALRTAPSCIKFSLVQYLSFKTLSIKFQKELPPVPDRATFWVWYFLLDVPETTLSQHWNETMSPGQDWGLHTHVSSRPAPGETSSTQSHSHTKHNTTQI